MRRRWKSRARRAGQSPLYRAVREASYPPPYPDGWYRVAASADIKRGQVKYVECVGQQIALFRSDLDGRIHALQAFCPHLGANLADGEVTGGQLRCPFHGWCIDGDGVVKHIPYSDRLPSKRHAHWDVADYYGMVVLYHSGDGPCPAPYRLPAQPKIDSGQFVYRGQYVVDDADMHIIEFAENGADLQHFSQLHGDLLIPWTRIRLPFCKVRHRIGPIEISDCGPVCSFRNEVDVEVFGRGVQSARSITDITYHGPASLIQFDFDFPGRGGITIFQTCTPVQSLKQHIELRWYADRNLPRLLVFWTVGGWVSQLRMDTAVWKRKIYRRPPMLTAGDGPMQKMRRWYEQFYATQDRN